MYPQGVDVHEDGNRVCDIFESTTDVFRRLLTQIGFSKEELVESWAEMRGCVLARLHVT